MIRRHPRIFFLSEDLPALKKYVMHTMIDEATLLGSLIKESATLLNEREFTITYYGGKKVTFQLPPVMPGRIDEPPGFDYKTFGHYPYWTGMAGHIQGRLMNLSLAYVLTEDRRFAEKAILYSLSLSRWATWTDPEYGYPTCLDTGYLTIGLSTCFDLCYDELDNEERERMVEGLVTLGLKPLLRDSKDRIDHNLQVLRNAALGLGGLTISGDHDSEEFIEASKEYFLWYLESRLSSSNFEGLGYGGFAMDYCLTFANALMLTVNDASLIKHKCVSEALPRMAVYFLSPDGSAVVNFSDSGYGIPYINSMRIISKRLGHPLAGWYLKKTNHLDGRGFTDIVFHDPRIKIKDPMDVPSSTLFPQVGWVALRSGWEEKDVLIGFQCSDSRMGHNHLDQNNLVINVAGEWILTDLGYMSFAGGAKTYYTSKTVGHNSLLIDGEGQVSRGNGKITDFFTSDFLDYTVGDASKAYRTEKVSKYIRRIVFMKPRLILILDEVKTKGAKEAEWTFHTEGKICIDGEEAAEKNYEGLKEWEFRKRISKLMFKLICPEKLRASVKRFEGAEEYGPYLEIQQPLENDEAWLLVAIQPAPSEEKIMKAPRLQLFKEKLIGLRLDEGRKVTDLCFNLTEARSCFQGIESDGELFSSSQDLDGGTRLAVYNGAIVIRKGKAFLEASTPLSIAVEETPSLLRVTLDAEKKGVVKLFVPEPKKVEGNLLGKEYKDGALTIFHPAGRSILEAKL